MKDSKIEELKNIVKSLPEVQKIMDSVSDPQRRTMGQTDTRPPTNRKTRSNEPKNINNDSTSKPELTHELQAQYLVPLAPAETALSQTICQSEEIRFRIESSCEPSKKILTTEQSDTKKTSTLDRSDKILTLSPNFANFEAQHVLKTEPDSEGYPENVIKFKGFQHQSQTTIGSGKVLPRTDANSKPLFALPPLDLPGQNSFRGNIEPLNIENLNRNNIVIPLRVDRIKEMTVEGSSGGELLTSDRLTSER